MWQNVKSEIDLLNSVACCEYHTVEKSGQANLQNSLHETVTVHCKVWYVTQKGYHSVFMKRNKNGTIFSIVRTTLPI